METGNLTLKKEKGNHGQKSRDKGNVEITYVAIIIVDVPMTLLQCMEWNNC